MDATAWTVIAAALVLLAAEMRSQRERIEAQGESLRGRIDAPGQDLRGGFVELIGAPGRGSGARGGRCQPGPCPGVRLLDGPLPRGRIRTDRRVEVVFPLVRALVRPARSARSGDPLDSDSAARP